jgi:hypothetical protein
MQSHSCNLNPTGTLSPTIARFVSAIDKVWFKAADANSGLVLGRLQMTTIIQTATVLAALLLGVFPAGAQPFATQFGQGSVGEGSNKDTKWVSICPSGTFIVSGSCIAPGGSAVPLKSFGMNYDNNSWECVWTRSVPKADVRAFCSSKQ